VDDDSPDKTWKVAMEISQDKDDVHVIRRVGKRGLSSAVIDGFLAAKGDVLAVMDADGQHDMKLLPELYRTAQGNKGFAVGSRYIEGGSVGEWDERRRLISRVATRMALALCKVKVKDPMSGFFALDRRVFEAALPRLNPKGFKILLDLLVHAPKGTGAVELPFTFSARLHGESKLSWRVQMDFIEYLYDVTFGRYLPLTFVKYCIVGSYAVAFYAEPRYTKDMDLWIGPSSGNIGLANRALTEFGSPMLLSVNDLTQIVQIGVAPNRIDLLLNVPNVRFETAWKNKSKASFNGTKINILGKLEKVRPQGPAQTNLFA